MPIQSPKNEEEERIFDCIECWMQIAEHAGRNVAAASIGQFSINMRKSSLLRRLLDGKEPFSFPPPKSYSYPWYSLLEEGSFSGYLAHSFLEWNGKAKLNINQTLWDVIEQLGEHHYLVQYNPAEGSVWELTPMTPQEVFDIRRSGTISSRSDEEVWKDVHRDVHQYGHLKLHTPGKNTV